jgi:hypothetical protein
MEYQNKVRVTFHTNCNSALPERSLRICGVKGALNGTPIHEAPLSLVKAAQHVVPARHTTTQHSYSRRTLCLKGDLFTGKIKLCLVENDIVQAIRCPNGDLHGALAQRHSVVKGA